MFLDREIKTRKQAFGVEIYDLMEELETADSIPTAEKEAKIRAAFDQARKDIAVIQAKKECKKEEMSVLETETAATNNIPPSSGTVLTNSHPQDSEVGTKTGQGAFMIQLLKYYSVIMLLCLPFSWKICKSTFFQLIFQMLKVNFKPFYNCSYNH